jgi:hypothetical protein
MVVFGRSTYAVDVESGGSADGSPMGGAEEYYYSNSVSPASPLALGGDDINDETRGAMLNGGVGAGGLIDFAGAGAEAAWLASGGVNAGVNGNVGGDGEGAFYARSLSLPSMLDQFQFPVGFDPAVAAAEAMIDPSILSAASVAMPAEGAVGGAAPETVKESWADWVNFDAEVKV